MNCSSTSEIRRRLNVADGGVGEEISENMYWRTLLLQNWLEKPKRKSESDTKRKKVLGFYRLQLLGLSPEHFLEPKNETT